MVSFWNKKVSENILHFCQVILFYFTKQNMLEKNIVGVSDVEFGQKIEIKQEEVLDLCSFLQPKYKPTIQI